MAIVMKLEAAAEKDLDQILQLQRKAFHGQALIYNDCSLPSLTQTLDDLKREFTCKTIYKVVSDGNIIASIRCFVKDRTLYIEKLIVDPDLQNRGIGSWVMAEVENSHTASVDRYELSTGHKSARNLHLYKKLGYHEIRREPLNVNCDLIVLEKNKVTRSHK
jgi:ribosomal protein S18 acetylase RimI-like enzyme